MSLLDYVDKEQQIVVSDIAEKANSALINTKLKLPFPPVAISMGEKYIVDCTMYVASHGHSICSDDFRSF